MRRIWHPEATTSSYYYSPSHSRPRFGRIGSSTGRSTGRGRMSAERFCAKRSKKTTAVSPSSSMAGSGGSPGIKPRALNRHLSPALTDRIIMSTRSASAAVVVSGAARPAHLAARRRWLTRTTASMSPGNQATRPRHQRSAARRMPPSRDPRGRHRIRGR